MSEEETAERDTKDSSSDDRSVVTKRWCRIITKRNGWKRNKWKQKPYKDVKNRVRPRSRPTC